MSIEVDGLAADFDSRMVEDSAFFTMKSRVTEVVR